MFRFNHDDTAFFPILDTLLFYETVSLDPGAVRIIQQIESIWATFLYYQETGIPLETSFHESLRLKADYPRKYRMLIPAETAFMVAGQGSILAAPFFNSHLV